MKVVVFGEYGWYVCDCVIDEFGVFVILGLNVFSGYV